MRLTLLALAVVGLFGTNSYRRLPAADEARFYRTGGDGFVGRRVHLHVTPAPFLKPPEKVRPPTAPRIAYHQYTYRRVKFLVHPGNPYYQQFRRKRKAGKVVCVKGKVVRFGREIGVAVVIHRIRAITRPKKRSRG